MISIFYMAGDVLVEHGNELNNQKDRPGSGGADVACGLSGFRGKTASEPRKFERCARPGANCPE
jgi:hypothetical protein